jgi:peptidoglycan L-alanyl-D-glutamate endopeptidase CwlK
VSFLLGRSSRGELVGVHPNLVHVVERGIVLTVQDFSVFDGLRTLKEQQEYVRTGVSKTLNSRHLKQESTGFGHAVDLVPYINRKLRWEWQPLYRIAEAMHAAANELDVRLRWGAVWDREFNQLDATDLESEVEAYVARRKAAGKRAFLDGPHYELA